MSAVDDPQLVALVQATGDVRAYETLVKRHHPALLSFLSSLGEPELADDAAQRALLKAYEKIDQFAHRSSFRTWLFTIGRRELAMLQRRERRHLGSPQETEIPETNDRREALDNGLALEAALSRLPPLERAALLLCDAHGFSHSEAAEAMEIPLGSLKTYTRRAREKMRAWLEAEEMHDG